MKKKKGGGGGSNWMDTYGDMVTLLLCFFVLLYSMSTISEENYKALVMSFNPNAETTLHATPGGSGPNADADEGGGEKIEMAHISQAEVDEDIEELFQSLKQFAESEGQAANISVTKGAGKVFVTFNDTVFFNPDDWRLRDDSHPILDAVCGMLNDAEVSIDEVRVLGHTAQGTPGEPNNPQVDRMLSAQRSATVVTYVQTHSNVPGAKLISEGIGQWQPVGDNNLAEGRAKNRRVEMIISGRDLELEAENIRTYTTS